MVAEEVPTTVETKVDVWVTIGGGIGIVIWEVGEGKEVFGATIYLEVEEIIGAVEVSEEET